MEKPKRKPQQTKETYRVNMLTYLGNPNNPWPTRQFMAIKVLNLTENYLYQRFTAAELDEIFNEGFDLRRKNMKNEFSVEADAALKKQVRAGDTAAIKLYYQRHEGWGETSNINNRHSGTIQVVTRVNREPVPGEFVEEQSESEN